MNTVQITTICLQSGQSRILAISVNEQTLDKGGGHMGQIVNMCSLEKYPGLNLNPKLTTDCRNCILFLGSGSGHLENTRISPVESVYSIYGARKDITWLICKLKELKARNIFII